MADGWTVATLGEIAELVVGRTPPRKEQQYWTDGLERPFCTIADMDALDVRPRREGVTRLAEEEGKARRVPAGSLLMSFKLTIGRVGFAAVDLFPNEAIVWIQPDDEIVPEYLALWLGHQDLTAGSGRAVKGATLNAASLRAIPVAWPSLAHQRRIVDLIDAVDRVVRDARSNVEGVEAARQAMRQDLMASGKRVPLASLCSIEAVLVDPTTDAHSGRQHIGIDRIESATGRLLPTQTAEQDAVTSAKFLFGPEDVVLSKIRPNLRKAVFPRQEGLASADAYPLRPAAGVRPEVLLEVLLSDEFTAAAVARSGRTKMPKINRTELFSIEVPVIDVERQDEVADLFTSLRSATQAAADVLRAALDLRSSVLESLLSGDHPIPESYDTLLESV